MATPGRPLIQEMPYRPPMRYLAGVAERPGTLLFDSAAPNDPRGRYSYLCIDPADWIEVPAEPAPSTAPDAAPLRRLQDALRTWPRPGDPELPPFQGGAAGLFGYELGGRLERLPRPSARGARHPDMAVGLYDVVLAFDHAAGRAWLISNGFPETEPAARIRRAALRLDEVGNLLAGGAGTAPEPVAVRQLDWQSDTPRAAYLDSVRRAIAYIEAGDIFQVNLSRELSASRPADLDAFSLYNEMRGRTRAPFSAYMRLRGGEAVCSFSPERFLQVDAQGAVETRPIKGTRPRGRTAAEDAAYAADLTGATKDHAENLMIVDLLRNDLARSCAIGSVRVPQLCGLESFEAVHHLVSVVTGRLAPGRDALDLLMGAFPGGSITGAPKIRAMEIIHELEARRRGPYCGSIAWLGFDGAMDSSILIRTMALDEDSVRYGVGGGIVYDSEPDAEWWETEVKAAAFLAPPGERPATAASGARGDEGTGDDPQPERQPRQRR
jgi:para-aminobenzoate synthetase component 1